MKHEYDTKKFVAMAEAREQLKCPYGLSFPSWFRCKGCKFFYEVDNKASKYLQEDIRHYIYYRIEKGEEKGDKE